MPTVTLPDGKTKSFDKPVTGLEVAQSIGAGLAKAALAVKIDGETRDLSTVIDRDAKVALITQAKPGQPTGAEALTLIRHSAAHVMAEAIQDVVGKEVLLAYGPPTETGFFYDMYVPAGKTISSELFDKINARIAEIIKEDRPFTRYDTASGDGLNKLDEGGEQVQAGQCGAGWGMRSSVYHRAAKAVRRHGAAGGDGGAAKAAALSFYVTGQPGKNWEDLCRGPHVPSRGRSARTGHVAGFELLAWR